MAAEQNLQRHHALNVQLADTLVKLIIPNLPNPRSAYSGKVRSEIEAAVPKGYDAVMKALQPHMTGGYGQYITRAVNSALANPNISELRAAVNEAASSFQSMSPAGAAPAMPAAGAPAQTGATQLARGGTRAVQRWQQNYNRVNKLKPGTPGYLKPDGLWGPATQAAYKKMQPVAPAAPQQQVMPPEPPAPPPSLRTYESIYPRLAEEFNQKIGPLRNYPAVEQILRQKAKDWERLLATNPGFSDRGLNWLIQKQVQNLAKEDLRALEQGGPGVSQVQQTRKYQ